MTVILKGSVVLVCPPEIHYYYCRTTEMDLVLPLLHQGYHIRLLPPLLAAPVAVVVDLGLRLRLLLLLQHRQPYMLLRLFRLEYFLALVPLP
jgi:hypothetical protein